MPVKMADRIRALTREVRDLKDELRVFDLNYSYLRDLLNDTRFCLKHGKPLDQILIAELMRFDWKHDGRHVKDGRELP